MKYYAGIGSRETPSYVLEEMEKIAQYLGDNGYCLRSGGAEGADTAFEQGCDEISGDKEIYIPWNNFNSKWDRDYGIWSLECEEVQAGLNKATKMAEQYHPRWSKLSQGVKKLMIRNSLQIFGYDMLLPVELVICWTPNGKVVGGTGQALRIAEDHEIRIINLQFEEFNYKYEW